MAARFPDRPLEALSQGVRKMVPGPESLLSSATGGCQALVCSFSAVKSSSDGAYGTVALFFEFFLPCVARRAALYPNSPPKLGEKSTSIGAAC